MSTRRTDAHCLQMIAWCHSILTDTALCVVAKAPADHTSTFRNLKTVICAGHVSGK